MSTQQDIYAAGSESHPPMLNKENYVPWSSRLLRYAKSRQNRKLIYNSILNGPYVRLMSPEPGDLARTMEADDQAIQTILLGLPEDIYAAVDKWSRHVTIVHQTKDLHIADYTQLYDFLKYNQEEVDELRAERLGKTHDPLALMVNSNNPFNYPVFHQDQPSSSTDVQQPQPINNYNPQPSFNQNYMQQPMLNPEDILDPTTAMNMALALMAKAFKLNYSTPTKNNQRISSNPRNKQIAQSGMNLGQDRKTQMVEGNVQNPGVQNVGNQNGLIVVLGIANQNLNGNGNVVAAQAEGNAMTQLLIAQKEEARIQLQVEEFDLMDAVADLDDIKKVNANCILMANLQQASTSGSHADKTSVYDSDRSVEKQQSLYNGKVLLEKHDPPTVHDSEETLELAQEKFSDDDSPSIARKFLNEVKITFVTLQRVVKQKMILDIHNWSSSAHQEIHKTIKDEIFPIVNQVNARVQNFEIQFLKEAAKFVRDFQSLAKEADESLAKHKALELEIKRLLRAVVSQDIMSIVQSNFVVDTSDLQTELDRTNEKLENCMIKKEKQYAIL
nr:hypothetical protein [Tanacetum cinerariifolium]